MRAQDPFHIRLFQGLITLAVLVLIWFSAVWLFEPAHFILPGPERVFAAIVANTGYLAHHAGITLTEMIIGFLVGGIAGILTAVLLAHFAVLDRFLMPVVITTQTLPVFAIAPLLVIWFGLGLGSKIVMASLIIFFPVASALYDGLKGTPRVWLDLGDTWGSSPVDRLLKIRLPAALPSLGSGLKIAATVAPIGAIVGEWAGASGGLGFIMLQANARMQTDLVFASLVILAVSAFLLRWCVVQAVDRFLFWHKQI